MTRLRFAFGLWSMVGCAAAGETYTFPIVKDVDARGKALYVDDGAVKARVPLLKDAGARIQTCASGMYFPPILSLVFEPKVSGPHAAFVPSLSCEFKNRDSLTALHGEVVCDAGSASSVGFDDDPKHYFYADPDVDKEEALAVFREFFSGNMTFSAKDERPDLANIRNISIAKDQNAYIVRWGDCGCTSSLRVESHGKGANRSWSASNQGRLCH